MATCLCLLFSMFLVLLFSHTATSNTDCPVSYCGDEGHEVRFPFRLTGAQRRRCGYPGFDLSCNNQTQRLTLNLPKSGNFKVRAIDYMDQTVWIADPDRCLSKRFLETLDLSGSPFSEELPEFFAFFNCSSDVSLSPGTRLIIPCLSGDNYTVVAVPMDPAMESFASEPSISSCASIATVSIPGVWYAWPGMGEALRLTWRRPDCRSCEENGGSCGFKSNSGLDIGCSGLPSNGLPRGAKYGISIGVGVPALLCVIGFSCFLAGKVRDYSHRHRHPGNELSTSVASQPAVIVSGLDGPTIESYPKTLLGESKRLPKPSDNTCPICLSEYQPKEILRTIPDCNHYFHVDCIDEWLRLNGTCPLCRNSPDHGSAQFTSSSSSSSLSTSSSSSPVSFPS